MKIFTASDRAILSEMVRTNFKVRYQGSALGYLWSLLKPLAMFGIIFTIFSLMGVGRGIDYFAVYLLVGIVLWNFFSEATIMGTVAIATNGALIRKINIPKYLIIIASSVSALINLGFSFLAIIIFAFASGAPFGWQWLILIPVVLELFIFSTGLSFLLSALYVQFRDMSYIWEIILQAGFYASAVIFPINNMPNNFRRFFFMNPMVQIIQDARQAILFNTEVLTIWNTEIGWQIRAVCFVVVVVVSFFGIWFFNKKSKHFAERI